jgi:hypothetical protein
MIPTTSIVTAGPMNSLKKRLGAMKFYGQVSRRVVATSSVLLGAVVFLGLTPWKVVAAEAENGEKPMAQRIATMDAVIATGRPLSISWGGLMDLTSLILSRKKTLEFLRIARHMSARGLALQWATLHAAPCLQL